jgi:hypothetical protein
MDLDLQRMENQGYLSGLRRVYHHQHQRQHSNKSSSQDSSSDPATPWSFTNTTLTVSSTKGSSSPDHCETRATTPEPMGAICTEKPHTHTILPLHPFGHESNLTINSFTCTTTATTHAPSSMEIPHHESRKPSILLFPAPVASTRSSPASSLVLSPSSTSIPDERTPLLPLPTGSTKGTSIHCNCDTRNKPTSSTSTLQDGHHLDHHCHNSTSAFYQKQTSSHSSSSSYLTSISFFSSTKFSHHLCKVVDWIQPHFSALPWSRSSKEKGLDQQQHQPDNYHISIDIPSDNMDVSTSTTTELPATTHHMYDTWEDPMVMAKRPIL